MKLNTILKNLLLLSVALLFTGQSASAQVLLNDDLSTYTVGTVVGQSPWSNAVTAGAVGDPTIVATPLTLTTSASYIHSGVGQTVLFPHAAGSTHTLSLPLSSAVNTPGTVYLAYMAKFEGDTLGAASGIPILGLAQNSTTIRPRVYVKKGSSSSQLVFGVVKNIGTVADVSWDATATEYPANVPHLLVLKYTIVSGSNNDIAELFVDPIPGQPEPTPTVTVNMPLDLATADATTISHILIRGNGSVVYSVLFGGLRVATTWADAVTTATPAVSTKLSDLTIAGTTINGFNTNTTNYTVVLANDATVTPVVAATTVAASDVTVTLNPVSGSSNTFVNDTAVVTVTVEETATPANNTVYTVTFIRDVVAPTFTATPIEGAAVSRTGTITLNFSEVVSINGSCTNPVLFNGLTPANFGVLAGNGLSWSIDYTAADWNGTDALTLTIPAGLFTDGYGNLTAAAFLLNLAFDPATTGFVEDVVYYTDFATTSWSTPRFVALSDSIISNNVSSSRLDYTINPTTSLTIDDFVFSTINGNRTIQIYGYNSNSNVGQDIGLSWGRVTMNNHPSTTTLPAFQGPFKLMYGINNGGTNLRILSLSDNTGVLRLDSVGTDGTVNLPNAKLVHYDYTGSDLKAFSLNTVANGGQIHDIEVIKTVPAGDVTPFYSHWFNPTLDSGLNPTGLVDVRFNKRIKADNLSLITIAGATVDSVKCIGNSARIYFTAPFNATLTVNVPVGAVKQETTNQALTSAASYAFSIRSPKPDHDITAMSVIAGTDTTLATITALAISAELPTTSVLDVDSIAVTFKASDGAVVTVNDSVQTSGVTVNDFTNPVNYVVTAEDGTSATYIVTITKAGTPSAINPVTIDVIRMYPNPATEAVTIEGRNIRQVTLFDLAGKAVLTHNITTENAVVVPVESLSAGIYLVKIVTEDGSVKTAKFVKK
ncbi:hypothetical protein FACS1894201_00180 [Bacteroidia bacterium]|nr:hypothetical protein FACS1894201_00180 [Bacteroidia bacterium]